MTIDHKALMQSVLIQYVNAKKWQGAPFGHIKSLSNSHVGNVGQDFIELLCKTIGFDCVFPATSRGTRSTQHPWDMRIEYATFEVKTATEDISGNFQFNHVRYHREYEALLCLGIAPSNLYFGAWLKDDVVTGRAGRLVTMDKGSSATFKLTKSKAQIHPIADFDSQIIELLALLENRRQ
ncbi:MAG: hypothetical protein OXI78_07210 [Anaerolineaceae bacterium]|nr:hypothetical protein [Anaerolineaceae bacterium]